VELLELLQVMEKDANDEILKGSMDSLLTDCQVTDAELPNFDKEKIFTEIITTSAAVVPLYKRVWFKVAVAASVLLVGSLMLINTYKPTSDLARGTKAEFKNDVAPGSSKATLILSNGKSILLAAVQKGQIAKQGNSTIIKTANGQIVYRASLVSERNDEDELNLITTPRGGKWDVTLSDGTKVWLNASSSIRYPSAFIGNERKVEITGEAYFEVAHNAAKPFKVITKGQIVEVLGTHFNINAYDDEETVKTTLLEGKVRVSKGIAIATLLPGQQSVTISSNNSISVKNADTEQAIAWHNGYFQFDRSDIHAVTQQLSRWYDVDIKFQGKITQDKFGGSISRDATLSQVLHTLEQSMVRFKIDGKTVTVME